MNRVKFKVICSILIAVMAGLYFQACTTALLSSSNNMVLLPNLKDYGIFEGKQSDLIPTNDFKLYELSSQLFTDYAEKQRLIKIPAGTTLSAIDNGLLDFPSGTILVKTFFYYRDKREPSKGKEIIETRLLIKSGAHWNVGTYQWNDDQTDASLITTGLNKTINWIDRDGVGNAISYHIPSNKECAACHSSNNAVIPIGPKVRNLNRDVVRNDISQNQLQYFHNEGLLNSVNPALFERLPDYKNTAFSLEERARAYLDINCAHCHTENGFASNRNLKLGYELPVEETNIDRGKSAIKNKMQKRKMPKLGTSIVDDEGLALIKAYINSLP